MYMYNRPYSSAPEEDAIFGVIEPEVNLARLAHVAAEVLHV